MTTIYNSYYQSEWSGLTKKKAIEKAKVYENEVSTFLLRKCGFRSIITTRDSIFAERHKEVLKGKNTTILPDLFGGHENCKNYFIEIKRKNRRLKYNDTGFDVKYIDNYLVAQKDFNARVVVLFKDNEGELAKEGVHSWFLSEDGTEVWYGGFLDNLNKAVAPANPKTTIVDPYNENNAIRCFPLTRMRKAEDIWKMHQTILRPAFG